MAPRLTADDIRVALQSLPDWSLQDDKLHRVFKFADFIAAFGFMSQVALLAERINHHPEWCNNYRTVSIALISHDAVGITQKDIDLAMAISRLI